jgi:hypothetical protein
MENLQITKKLRAFCGRMVYAYMIGASILLLNSCSKTADEQIKPRQVQVNSTEKQYNIYEQENFEGKKGQQENGNTEKPNPSDGDLPTVEDPWKPQIPSED